MKNRILSVIVIISIIIGLFSGLNISVSADEINGILIDVEDGPYYYLEEELDEAYDYETPCDCKDGFFYQIIDDHAIIRGIDTEIIFGNVTLPSIIDGYTVTQIGEFAFNRCTEITSVTIPNTVTVIGTAAFYRCLKLTQIYFSDSVTSIGRFAFGYCIELTSIIIPESVTQIGSGAFLDCIKLKNVIMSENITKIADGLFCDCINLTNIIIPENVKEIEDCAFFCCEKLKTINIPNNVTCIDEYTFFGCRALKSIEIPNSVKHIDTGAFYDCIQLKDITIPSSVTSLGNSVFSNCTGLTNIKIPNSVTSIGSFTFNDTAWYNNQPDGLVYAGKVAYGYKGKMASNVNIKLKSDTLGIAGSAFWSCSELSSIEIPKNITNIGRYAFSGCKGLKSVTIPQNVKNIGDSAFYGCEKLKTVYYAGTKSQKSKIKIKDGNKHLTKATWKYAARISLSASKYTYNGKAKTPTVTVKDAAGKKLTKNKDYTVSYAKGRKNVGKYTVKVTLKNSYYNNSPTRYITINPKSTSISKLTKPKTKQIKVTWKKQATQTTGYQIQYSTSKTFKSGNKTVTISKNKTRSKTLTGLKAKKTYYVRIRTYKTVGKTKYYSAWSKAKSIKTK